MAVSLEVGVIRDLEVLAVALRPTPIAVGGLALAHPRFAVALCLGPGRLAWHSDAGRLVCADAEGLLLNVGAGGGVDIGGGAPCMMVLTTHRKMTTSVLSGLGARCVRSSVALEAMRGLSADLLADGPLLTAFQAKLVGRALLELMDAALLPLSTAGVGLIPRRETSLLERVVAHVDRHLTDRLDPEELCEALVCSRSTLYRALHPAGGASALVTERRLAAAYRVLSNPAERRSIGTIAGETGFTDPARFSRSFQRRYGLSASELRRRHATSTRTGAR